MRASEIESINIIGGKYIITPKKGKNGYLISEAFWAEVPRFHKNGKPKTHDDFKKEVIDKEGIKFFEQNHGNEFLGSSSTLVSGDTLKSLTHIDDDNIIFDMIIEGLRVFYEPEDGHNYIIGADPAKDGIDDFAIQIIDITKFPFVLVASANLQISYLNMPSHLNDLGAYYNNALIVIENNLDQYVVDTLFEQYEYDNLYIQEKVSKLGKVVRTRGFRTTVKTKKIIISHLKKFMDENVLDVGDYHTIQQLFNFIQKPNGSYSAEDGYKDDLVMALALCFAPFLEVQRYENHKDFIATIDMDNNNYDKEVEDTMAFIEMGSFDDGTCGGGYEQEPFDEQELYDYENGGDE